MFRRLFLIATLVLGSLAASVGPASAATCVRFSTGVFDSPGADTRSNSSLNAEWVRIRNYCSTAKSLSGWTINDYGKTHTYKFPTGAKIAPGTSITLHTGKGTNTSTHRYWGLSNYVWNNTCPERAYLRSSTDTLISKWSSC